MALDSGASFDKLVDEGFVEEVSIEPDGKPKHRPTAKAADHLYKLDVLKPLKQNSPKEIRITDR